jgi:prepilin-type N-terminal cleavage/methylation domain-containing protein
MPIDYLASKATDSESKTAGFTLTELAIVLVIVSLLIGGMIIPLSAQMGFREVADTEKTLSEAKEALIGFAVVNRRFPRPAVSATDGRENPAACLTDVACSGRIPWETLGVRKLDAWNKIIRYSVSPVFAGGATGTDPINLTSTPTKNVRARDSSAVADAPLATGVPAVVFSHGKFSHGEDNAGNTLPDSLSNNADEDANNTASITFYSRLISTDTSAPGGEFDDIVTWVSSSVLFNRMIAAGRLP